MAQSILPQEQQLTCGTNTFRLKQLNDSDLTQMVQLESTQHPHPWQSSHIQSSLQSHQCFGLFDQSTLIAHAVISFVVGEAELLLFVLHQSYRGQGVASAFLRALMQAAQQHATSMFLEVRESNAPAIALYEACHFNQVGCRANYYPAKRGREDALIYVAELIA